MGAPSEFTTATPSGYCLHAWAIACAACSANSIGGAGAAGGGGGLGAGTAVGCRLGRGTPLSPGRGTSPGRSLPAESTAGAVRTAATHAVIERTLLPIGHLRY